LYAAPVADRTDYRDARFHHAAHATDDDDRRILSLRDGRTLVLRRIRPDDEAALLRAFARLTPDQIRRRVFHRMNELPAVAARRMAALAGEDGAAFVATDPDDGQIRGDARLHVDAVLDAAEFGVIVDPAFEGVGLGQALVERLLEECRARGLAEMWGDVLADNVGMLDLARRLGARRRPCPGDAGLCRVSFDLRRT
jgi:acetyltransferase